MFTKYEDVTGETQSTGTESELRIKSKAALSSPKLLYSFGPGNEGGGKGAVSSSRGVR